MYFFVILWDVFQFDWHFDTREQWQDTVVIVFLCGIVGCVSV